MSPAAMMPPQDPRCISDEGLELARIGSLLFILDDSPNDQIGSLSPIDTFATRLSAQPLIHRSAWKYGILGSPHGAGPAPISAPGRERLHTGIVGYDMGRPRDDRDVVQDLARELANSWPRSSPPSKERLTRRG